MFLVIICCLSHIIEYILNFIENHSVLVGIITAVITGSFWFKKYLRQKRADALGGFYAQLSMRLKALTIQLNYKSQLNILDSKAGNIYSLIYINPSDFCPKYTEPTEEQIKLYATAASGIKKLLLETNDNVYPYGADKKKWYDSQYKLLLFCEFLENEEYRHRTNKEFDGGCDEPKHITKCKSLITAINYIQNAIEKTKY